MSFPLFRGSAIVSAMQLLLAVVDDLASFAYDSIRSLFVRESKQEIPVPRAPLYALEAPAAPVALLRSGFEVFEAELPIPTEPPVAPPSRALRNTVMYTASIATPLRSSPATSGDATVGVLPYGSMVMVLKSDDAWAYVASGGQEGWVYAEDLEDRAAHVYPAFHIGEENRDDDPATVRLRALIEDAFGAGEIALPLQAEEYVLYRLIRRGVKIAWPPVRPRSPGMWASILKDVPTVRIGAKPTPGSVMEFMLTIGDSHEPLGHLAYVEAVFPDGSLQISEANWPDQGVYNERVLVEGEWRELAPSFLQFT